MLDRFGSVWTGQAKRWRPSLEYVYCCMVNRSLTIEMVLDKKNLKKKKRKVKMKNFHVEIAFKIAGE